MDFSIPPWPCVITFPLPAGSPCSGAVSSVLQWQPGVVSEDYQGDASKLVRTTNRAQGGEINVVCRRLSCVFCRFMLQWTLDVGWISWLTFKQKTKKLHLRIYRPWQELSMFWWMSQLAGGEQIKDCWVALPNILVSVEILFQNYFKIKNYWVCSRKNPSLGERSGIPCGLCLRTGLRDILTKKFF